jgi:hypothetical protein
MLHARTSCSLRPHTGARVVTRDTCKEVRRSCDVRSCEELRRRSCAETVVLLITSQRVGGVAEERHRAIPRCELPLRGRGGA